MGDLADLLIRFGLGRISDAAIRDWANKRPSARGPLGGGLRKHERAVVGAFERLQKAEDGATRFLGTELASEAGLRLTEAFWALKSLQARGMVSGVALEEVDKWGRPVKSYWKLTPTEG